MTNLIGKKTQFKFLLSKTENYMKRTTADKGRLNLAKYHVGKKFILSINNT